MWLSYCCLLRRPRRVVAGGCPGLQSAETGAAPPPPPPAAPPTAAVPPPLPAALPLGASGSSGPPVFGSSIVPLHAAAAANHEHNQSARENQDGPHPPTAMHPDPSLPDSAPSSSRSTEWLG